MSEVEWGYKVAAGKTPRERHYGLGYAEGLTEGRRKSISPTVFKSAIKRALAEGEAKGRRLERQALRLVAKKQLAPVDLNNFAKWWCAARSKRGKVGK